MRVGGLYVYPVKSLRGLVVEEAEVEPRGFAGDRRFLIVDERGRFLTQRELPRMALVDVRVDGARLRIAPPGAAELVVPRRPAEGAARRVDIWGDACDAISLGPEPAAALSAWLGVRCELVYFPDGARREVAEAPGAEVGFADGFPFLVATRASLEELERQGAGALDMIRFRPNLVVDGAAPFAEDGWAELRAGAVAFRLVKPCARCPIPTIDPRTAAVGKEPLATLARIRRRGNEVLFGWNAVPVGVGRVRVGDEVTVVPR